jgi:osmotically-inducible protein OsmY
VARLKAEEVKRLWDEDTAAGQFDSAQTAPQIKPMLQNRLCQGDLLTHPWRNKAMNTRTQFFLIAIAMAATVVTSGCNKQPQETPTTSAASTGHISDMDISEHVKLGLLNNKALNGLEINVVTVKGDVRLTGVLNTQAQIDEALKIARAADGAHTLHNELTLKK